MGYSPWGRKESDVTEQLSMHAHFPRPMGFAIPLPLATSAASLSISLSLPHTQLAPLSHPTLCCLWPSCGWLSALQAFPSTLPA